MGWRIRQNELAHAPKWNSACMIHYTCVCFERAGAFAARDPFPGGWEPRDPRRKSPQPTRIYTHVWCIMHTLVHFGECANPFWRTRQSILSNAPIYFGECLILLMFLHHCHSYYCMTIMLLFYSFIFYFFGMKWP